MLQNIIVVIALTAAIAYAMWRIRYVIKHSGGRCYGCPIKDACGKRKHRTGVKDSKNSIEECCHKQLKRKKNNAEAVN